jgi:ketol-acid reductoisomerase
VFARDFLLENQVGQPRLKAQRAATAASQVAEVGARLRKMMPFIAGKGK